MKTAISIPDNVFRRADELARRRRISRSALVALALREYLDRHYGADVTGQLDQIYGKQSSELDPGVRDLQQASIVRERW